MLRLRIIFVALFVGAILPAKAQVCGDEYGKLISDGMSAFIESRRPDIEEQVQLELGIGNRFAQGITLYDIEVRLGSPDFRYRDNKILYTIRSSEVSFKSTTPSGLGSYADPAFELRFDIELRGAIIAPLDQPPYAEEMIARIPQLAIKPRNVTGSIVTTIVNIFVVSGPGAQAIQQAVDTHLMQDVTAHINKYLDAQTAGIAFMKSTNSGAVTTFDNPMYDCGGAPAAVDVCRSWGEDCGEPAAAEFCRRQGYKYALSFTTSSGRSPTWVPQSKALCIGPHCGSFSAISCSNTAQLSVKDSIKSGPFATAGGSRPVEGSTKIPR